MDRQIRRQRLPPNRRSDCRHPLVQENWRSHPRTDEQNGRQGSRQRKDHCFGRRQVPHRLHQRHRRQWEKNNQHRGLRQTITRSYDNLSGPPRPRPFFSVLLTSPAAAFPPKKPPQSSPRSSGISAPQRCLSLASVPFSLKVSPLCVSVTLWQSSLLCCHSPWLPRVPSTEMI